MANWEKLNAEFDEVIDNMTVEDWREWYEGIKQRNKNQELFVEGLGMKLIGWSVLYRWCYENGTKGKWDYWSYSKIYNRFTIENALKNLIRDYTNPDHPSKHWREFKSFQVFADI